MGNVVFPSGTSVVPLCTTARACGMEWFMGYVVYPSGTSVVPLCTTVIAYGIERYPANNLKDLLKIVQDIYHSKLTYRIRFTKVAL